MKYYRNLYKNNSYMMALELINGTIVECYTEEDVLASCTVTTSSNTTITVNGITFIKNQVVSVYFGNGWNLNYTPDHFCRNFINLIYIDPLPDMIITIGSDFMRDCTSFNQPITIPESVTSIGNIFMFNCKSFNQPLILPIYITSIGTYFMQFSISFNQPLILSSLITDIGRGFLADCNNFTGPLEILFTDPNVFVGNSLSLAIQNYSSKPIYATGITITGNMTGAQLRTRLPNSSVSPYRKILD